MQLTRTLGLLLLLVLAACAAPRGDRLSEPPVVRSQRGVAILRMNAHIETPRLGPAFSYFVPHAPFWIFGAPTIEVRPGDRIRVAYRNLLPPILSGEAHGLPD